MQPEQTPFPAAWWAFDLSPYRPPIHQFATYTRYPYSFLPPLDPARFQGDFRWLTALNPEVAQQVEIHQPDAAYRAEILRDLGQLRAACDQAGIGLPPEFIRFMGATELQAQIPSCTACYFSLSNRPVPNPVGSGHLVRFLNDQQDCVVWYLYLAPNGDHCVVSMDGDVALGLEQSEVETPPTLDPEAISSINYCAPSFEVFVYRFWLENTIWFALNEGTPLTTEMRVYLAHYQPSGTAI